MYKYLVLAVITFGVTFWFYTNKQKHAPEVSPSAQLQNNFPQPNITEEEQRADAEKINAEVSKALKTGYITESEVDEFRAQRYLALQTEKFQREFEMTEQLDSTGDN